MSPSAFIPAASQSAFSQPISSPRGGLSGWLLAASAALIVCVLAGVPLEAQTAHFSGAIVTLGSGFATPTGVAVDGNGNVYVADNGHSAVKEIMAVNGSIPASPVINTLGSGFSNPFTVAVDGSGNVFVTDYGNHAVKEILAAGGYTNVRTLVSGTSFIFGSAVDGSGNVYYSEYGKNLVKKIVAVNGSIPASPKIITLGGGFNIPAGVSVDSSGNVFIGDQNNNALKEILASSGWTTTITVASGFNTPDGVAVDKNGNVFVANDGGNAVNEVLAVNGVIPVSPTVITWGTGYLQPFDVAVDGNGNVYVADRGNNAVKEIQTAGGTFGPVNVETISPSAITMTFTFDTAGTLGSTAVSTQGVAGLDFYDAGGGTCIANTAYNPGNTCTVNVKFSPFAPGTRYGAVELLSGSGALLATGRLVGTGVGPQTTFAKVTAGVTLPGVQNTAGIGFNGPGGVAVDTSLNIFVADSNNNVVKELLASSNWTTVNTLGSGFSFPNGVAVDGGGNVYVADTYNDAVKEIVAAGGYSTVISLGSGFSNPYGVAVDGMGNVFVADFANDAVKEIVAVGGSIPASPTIRTLANELNGPDGVAVDGNGNVFVANYGDGTVQEIVAVNGSIPASPTIKTIGTGLSGPSNLSVDGVGNVFVSDTENNLVKEIVAAGGYTTVKILGSGFSFPEAVAVGWSGDVFVADTDNNSVDRLNYSNPPLLAFGGAAVGFISSDSPQKVTLINDGNASLIFPVPGSGANPNVSANFLWDAASTCKQTTSSSSQPFALAGGASCTMAFDSKPTTLGTNGGNAVLTDNSLNVPGTTQTIPMSGMGVAPAKAVLTSPQPGSTLSGTSVAFSWTAGQGVSQYVLMLGTTGVGASDVYNRSTYGLTLTPTNIPAFGAKLYVRLYSQINGAWQYNDYTYTESGSGVKAVMSSPAPGSTLPGASAAFTWTAGGGVSQYVLRLGTTGAGSMDVYNKSTYGTTLTPTNIPTTGATLYVRLYSQISGAWQYNDYTYKEQ